MRHSLLVVSSLFAAGLGLASEALADAVDLVSTKDNTLYFDAGGALSNGSGSYVFSGYTASSEERRALLAFDVSGIPAGSTITSVSLTLHCSRAASLSGLFDLHRVTSSWGEGASNAGDPGGGGALSQTGDTTWLHRSFPDVLWAAPGGDFSATPSASATVGGIGFTTWSSPSLAGDVQAWVDSPTTNFGWLLKNSTGGFREVRRFDSRENVTESFRPTLHIEFTTGAPTCVADVDDGTGTGVPDGGVTIDDLLYYLSIFEDGVLRADVDDGTGTGTPDGGVTIDDLLYYLQRFESGC